MDGETIVLPQTSSAAALRTAHAFWSRFVDRCIRERIDNDRFQSLVRLVHDEHPLPPAAVADLFLRPQADNCYSLDPRVPPYLQVLSDLEYIDAPAILRALYRYSSSHTLIESYQVPTHGNGDGNGKGNNEGNRNNDDKEQDTGNGIANVKDTDTASLNANHTHNGEETKSSVEKKGSEDKKSNESVPLRWKSSYWVEEVMFFRLCKSVHEGQAVRDTNTALEVIKIVSKWLALFTQASSAFAADLLAQVHNLQLEMESARAAFVPLLLRLTDNPSLLKVIARPVAKDARRELSENLSNFVPTLQLVNAGTEKSIAEKLDFFRNEVLAKLDPIDKKKQAADAAMNDMLDSAVGPDSFEVREVPIITTRVGMYIYLNAALVGRPLVDDGTLFNYIHNRYRGDNQLAAMDLILASFDVLANAVFRDGGKEDAHLLKSFLINKVPLVLCQLLPPGFSNPSAELCITNALNQVDTSLFPTASLMFDESRNNNPYTESVREEFCAACVLHGLINREHVEAILGEMSMSYQPEKKSKDKLVQDYQSHTVKVQDLLGDLEKMDGNVAAVSHALVEVIRKLCDEKDTMSLKLLCTEIVQKPQSLDMLLLFETLPGIVGPLCQLLDNWRYDDDQAEYQPVYEEFGAILLLVLAFVNRYNLRPSDIGLYNPKSSVRGIIIHGRFHRDPSQLSEQETKHLHRWILGLFDNEGGGLGDELMSSCPPQEFYKLVASLFYNIVVGYSQGYINEDSLKSGVEYLVDTFLLPSLVPALRFLADYLWVDQKEQKAIIRVLQLILLPSAISNEASAMLASVKKIVAKPLDNALRNYLNRRDPKNQDIMPLLNALEDSIPMSKRTGLPDLSDVTEWCKSKPDGGLYALLKGVTQGLIQWSMQPAMSVMPITYTHRQLIMGIRLIGPQGVLRLLLEELRFHTRSDADMRNQNDQQQQEQQQLNHQDQIAGVVYDVATALACAPNVTNMPPAAPWIDNPPPGQQQAPPQVERMMGVPEVLRLEADKCRKMQKTDPDRAEIVVRLHRRVEAQLAPPQAPPGMMPAPDMGGMDMSGGMDMGANAEVSLDDAMAAMQSDPSGVGLDMSLDPLGSGDGGGDGMGGDDLFGGLDTNIDTNLDDLDWGDGMDLS